VLERGALQYYLQRWEADASRPEPKSRQPIVLTDAKVHAPARIPWLVGRPTPDTSFEIEMPSKKSVCFVASSMRDMQAWVSTLRAVADMRDPSGSLAAAPVPTPDLSLALPETSLEFRQPQTQLEAAEAAAVQEYNFLHEALQRVSDCGEGRSPEGVALRGLLDRLRPFLDAHQLSDVDGTVAVGGDSDLARVAVA